MEVTLYILLFIVGLIMFFLSTRHNDYDISNTYQVELSLLSLVIFGALALASFNIEIIHFFVINNVASSERYQYVDMTYFGISLAMFIMNLFNVVVIFTWGSFNRMFRIESEENNYHNRNRKQ